MEHISLYKYKMFLVFVITLCKNDMRIKKNWRSRKKIAN